jgi:hypothetical protein
VNSASYYEVLLKLWDAIHRKHPGQLARGILLHYDNATPPYSPSNPGENSRTAVGTSWTSALGRPHTNCVKTSIKTWDCFHDLIHFNCAPFFASCRRHRVLTVTCLNACRCAAYLTARTGPRQIDIWANEWCHFQCVCFVCMWSLWSYKNANTRSCLTCVSLQFIFQPERSDVFRISWIYTYSMDSSSVVPRDKGLDSPLPNFSSLMYLQFRWWNLDSVQVSYSSI